MKTVLVTRPLPQPVIAALAAAHKVAVRDETGPMSGDEMVAALRRFDAILPTIGDAFSAEIFAQAGQIRTRLLANFGVGYNHIDVAAASAHGIAVTNTPGVLTDTTADLALTLILMTARRAGEGERLLRAGGWTGWHPTQLMGMDVSGKVLGIVGMGRIGEAIARRGHFGFGMKVLFYNRSPKTPDLPARQVGSLAALAAACDVMVVAVPGGAETRHLIDADIFAAMKPTALFINIARGDVVDEAALIAALQAGGIAGAGLDVYEREPVVPEALTRMENVTLLPHLGSATLETRTAMGMLAADNILAFFAGKPLPSPV
ncbi:2-hydroxyacid dehydrogenase [Sinisalibacter aestuarii]|uniref:D-glycerate dehydrogenase n=1 Tax=Sinisalibacter aestuarii TaxID=2949426 RepID=A0ABQ5LPE6_9RHOB|nr:D-glycerate dehydrogenase [Sinisalibacter aestuarii]GKY86879.1 D-glycerate dehydrogenase [Sinisalibacter aestuarii]